MPHSVPDPRLSSRNALLRPTVRPERRSDGHKSARRTGGMGGRSGTRSDTGRERDHGTDTSPASSDGTGGPAIGPLVSLSDRQTSGSVVFASLSLQQDHDREAENTSSSRAHSSSSCTTHDRDLRSNCAISPLLPSPSPMSMSRLPPHTSLLRSVPTPLSRPLPSP